MKTHCKRGHPRTPENLRGKTCKICEQEKGRRRWVAKRTSLGGLSRVERTAVRRANRRTHCDAGHPLDPSKHGCKVCQVDKDRLRRVQKPKAPKVPQTQCKNGHPKGYFGGCKACRREAKSRRDKANPKARQARKRRYFQRHPEKARAAAKRYYERHPEARAKARAKVRAWRKEHPRTAEEMRAKQSRRRAKKTGAGGSYTPQEERALRSFYDHRCVCCWRTKEALASLGLIVVLDHVLAISKGGTSFISNMQPLCHHKAKGTAGCNEYKGDFHDTDYRIEGLLGLS